MKCWNEWRNGGEGKCKLLFLCRCSSCFYSSVIVNKNRRLEACTTSISSVTYKNEWCDGSEHQIGKTFSQAASYANNVFMPKGEKFMKHRSIQSKASSEKWVGRFSSYHSIIEFLFSFKFHLNFPNQRQLDDMIRSLETNHRMIATHSASQTFILTLYARDGNPFHGMRWKCYELHRHGRQTTNDPRW